MLVSKQLFLKYVLKRIPDKFLQKIFQKAFYRKLITFVMPSRF